MSICSVAPAPAGRKRIFLHYGADDGCFHHRILLPARHLWRELLEGHGVRLVVRRDPADHPSRSYSEPYDAYVFHGPTAGLSLDAIAYWKSLGRRFVWAADDAYDCVPDWNPARPTESVLGGVRGAHALADRVHASTDALAERLGRDRAVVLPNLIDLDNYPAPAAGRRPGPVRVCWAGSPTHGLDVELVVPALSRLLRERRGRVEAEFWGMVPEALRRDFLHAGLNFREVRSLSEYYRELPGLAPDVWLCPVIDCEFNRCKSNLKVLEGMALGAAVVCSGVGEYARLDSPGVAAVRWDDPDAWYEAVARWCDDPAAARAAGAANRRLLEAEWSWQHSPKKRLWREAFLEAVPD